MANEFKEVVNLSVQPAPARIALSDFFGTAWMKGETMTKEEFRISCMNYFDEVLEKKKGPFLLFKVTRPMLK